MLSNGQPRWIGFCGVIWPVDFFVPSKNTDQQKVNQVNTGFSASFGLMQEEEKPRSGYKLMPSFSSSSAALMPFPSRRSFELERCSREHQRLHTERSIYRAFC